jgi:hypothetical protein
MGLPTDTWLVFEGTDTKYRISAGRKVQHFVNGRPADWTLTTLVRVGDTICNLEGSPKEKDFRVIGILSEGALKYWKASGQ